MNPTPENVWLLRGGMLVFVVAVWLGCAWIYAERLIDDELLARGRTTVAEPRQGLDRFMPEKHEVIPRGKGVTLKQRKTYTYVAAGNRYEDYTTGETDPVGQTVTYLPEDPTVHRLGEIKPRAASEGCGDAVGWGILLLAPTLGFFYSCLVSPREDYEKWTPLRGWLIFGLTIGLATGQIVLVVRTISLTREPFLVILIRYVPAFVAGTAAAVLGARLLVWKWGGRQK